MVDYEGTYQEYVESSGGTDRLNADQVVQSARGEKKQQKLKKPTLQTR